MHMVCLIKQVPDTVDVKIDPETNTLIRAGVEAIPNPYDMAAVEEAMRLKEKYGGRVTAMSMGPPQADSVLRDARSLGVDETILLSDRAFAGADTLATSYTLAKALEKLHAIHPIDIALCGKQAIDGDTAQVGPGIATRLGYTQLTYVIAVDWIDVQERKIQVLRKVDGGIEVLRAPLPALLTVELELARPRRASLPRLIDSFRVAPTVWDAKAIGAEPGMLGLKGSPTWVRKISSPPIREGGPCFDAGEGAADAVRKCLDELFSDSGFASEILKKRES